jgi:hypothetical protein
VKLCAAPGATALESDALFDHGAALGAPHDLPEPRHVDVARTILRNATGSGRSARLLRRALRCRLLRTIPVVILVAAEAVFSVTHALSSMVAGIVCERKAVSKPASGRRESRNGPTQLAPFFTAWYVASHVASEVERERVPSTAFVRLSLLTAKQV